MKLENFNLAMAIIRESHSVHLIINKPTNGSIVNLAENPSIHIKSCPAAMINHLHSRKFSLAMSDGLLSVEDYSVS